MEIGETLYVVKREDWRSWLQKNHTKAKDIWLVFYNKKSGRARLPYDQAVEEALCFGWIDSIVKKNEADSSFQRLPAGKDCLHRQCQGAAGRIHETPESFHQEDPAEQTVWIKGMNRSKDFH